MNPPFIRGNVEVVSVCFELRLITIVIHFKGKPPEDIRREIEEGQTHKEIRRTCNYLKNEGFLGESISHWNMAASVMVHK